MNCVICGTPAEQHHLRTRKAHPEFTDVAWNKIPICRVHHTMFHSRGTGYMAARFTEVRKWLLKNEWRYDHFMFRWEHNK